MWTEFELSRTGASGDSGAGADNVMVNGAAVAGCAWEINLTGSARLLRSRSRSVWLEHDSTNPADSEHSTIGEHRPKTLMDPFLCSGASWSPERIPITQ